MGKKMSQEELEIVSNKIGRETFEHMKGLLTKELSKFDKVNQIDFINAGLIALCAVDCSILLLLIGFFKKFTGNDIDKVELFSLYVKGTLHVLQESEKRELISKLH